MPQPYNVESRVAVLEMEMASLKTSQMAMAQDVREIRDAVLGAKGGWKFMVFFGGVAATGGVFLTKLISVLWAGVPK